MSIEDDIKNVQELIDGAKRYGQYEGNKYYISMEHIISDYMMLKEIEKEHKKINERLKHKLLDTIKGTNIIKKETPEYIKENYVSKEKIYKKINYYDDRIRHSKLIKDKEAEDFYYDLKIAFEKLLQESEDYK